MVWPVTRQQVTARRSRIGLRRPGGAGGQPVLRRIVAVGWPGPFAALVLFARPSVGEVTAHPPPGSPRYARGRRYSVVERITPPLIYQGQKTAKWRRQLQIFFQVFFHLRKTAQDGSPHSALVHAFGPSHLPVALSKNDAGIHPAALGFRQGVERVP